MPESDPKIPAGEAITIGLFLLTMDAIDLIPVFGDITDIPAAGLFIYYYKRRINGAAYLIAEIIDLIPVLQAIPTRSIVWWGTVIYEDIIVPRLPKKLSEAVETLAEEAEGGGAEESEAVASGLQETEANSSAAANLTEAELEDGEAMAGAEGYERGEGESQGPEGAESGGSSEGSRNTAREERRQRRGDESEEAWNTDQSGRDDEDEEQPEEDAMASGAEINPEEEAEQQIFTLQEESSKNRTQEMEEAAERSGRLVNIQKAKGKQAVQEPKTVVNKKAPGLGGGEVVVVNDIKAPKGDDGSEKRAA